MKRIVRHALLILALMAAAALLFDGWQLAASVLVGGAVALAGFRWLEHLVDRFLEVASATAAAPSGARLALLWLLRLGLISGTLFAIFQLSFFRPLGAVGGLSIFVLAGMLEAAILAVQKKV